MDRPSLSAQEARESLYEIIRTDSPFEEKAQEALEVGKRYLGVNNGHMTRIDQETDHWEATASTDAADGKFPPGLELDLGTTYCRKTIESHAPIALHDASNQGWGDDPAFEMHELYCYHGTTLVVDGSPYGTICFVSEQPREEPFSDDDTMFAELLTRLLEHDLDRSRRERELTRQSNLASVLNRVLRHNLRNDLSVIRGHTRLMADQLDETTPGETANRETATGETANRETANRETVSGEVALKKIDNLIELSQKAQELDRIIATEFERESINLTQVAEQVGDRIASRFPSASIAVQYDEPIEATVYPSFERAIEELVENGAKHGGNQPAVEVEIRRVPNGIAVVITDDGPGLSDPEVEVLETGAETPLIHGSGIGLWLTHWIVSSHDGTIEPTVTESGTTMEVTVPSMATTGATKQLSAFRRARDQYQAAFEEATDAMLLLDDDARIIDANEAASLVYGRDRTELRGQPIENFLPDDLDFEREWEAFTEAGEERDTVAVVASDSAIREAEYTATTDVVPGQHLVVSREQSS